MEILPISIKKEIQPGDDLSAIILSSFPDIHDNDIIVVAQKIISKQEGRLVYLSNVIPSLLAQGIASEYDKDPKLIEIVLSETNKIIRMNKGIIIVETKTGFICANAGVDESNVPNGFATLLPVNADKSAEDLRISIMNKIKKNVAIIISDTFGRPFRMGQTNHAIGLSGISSIIDYRGTVDDYGRILRVTEIAIADELCAAAELVMKKTIKCPVAIIRNFQYAKDVDTIQTLLRKENEDLFR